MLSLKDKIYIFLISFCIFYMMLVIFSILSDAPLPFEWVYHAVKDEELSFFEAWKINFLQEIEASRESSYRIAQELEENVR